MGDIKMYTPNGFAYETGTSFSWLERSYWNAQYPNTVLGVPIRSSNEAASDDWLVADPSTQTPLYPYKGERVCYSILPFILVSQTGSRLYDLGFKTYANPSDKVAEQYLSVTYNFTGASLSPTDKHDADKSNGTYNVSGFGTDNTGVFPLGVMDGANYSTRQSDLRNLKTSYWTSSFGGLTTSSNRVIVTPANLAEAIDWWEAGASETGNYDDGIVDSFSYGIKKWGDGGRGSTFIQYGTSFTSNSYLEIPANGAMWGYIYMTITNSNNTENDIKSGGSTFNISTHSQWTTGGLRQAGLADTTNTPWDASAAYPRRIEYGMHVVARKAGA